MKRLIGYILGMAIGLALLITGIILTVRLIRRGDTDNSNSMASHTVGWVVSVWEDKLAVFPAGGDTPSRIYDVHIASLPSAEQTRLREGIIAENDVTLAALIEDYTG